MSQDFKLKFNKMRENDVSADDPQTSNEADANYPSGSNTRNLCFSWPDGRMKFLNYAYLISVEYTPSESVILMVYTTDKVNMKGLKLEVLFKQLMEHLPKIISCQDARYNGVSDDQAFIVNEIVITNV